MVQGRPPQHLVPAVSTVIERLQPRPRKYRGTGLSSIDPTPAGPSPDAAVVPADVALWAEKAPTQPHSLLNRHPTDRLLRDLYRYGDRWRAAAAQGLGW